jgi:hypothetical protein
MEYFPPNVRRSLLYKYLIVRLVDEFGVNGLFDRANHAVSIFKSKPELGRLKEELSETPDNLLNEVNNRIASRNYDFFECNVVKVYGFIRSDLYRKQRSANDFDLQTKTSFRKLISGDKILKKEIYNLKCNGLINDAGQLSAFGKTFSYQNKPLPLQCEYVGVPIIEHQIKSSSDSIEQCVALDLSNIGGDWFFAENHLWRFLLRELSEPLLDQIRSLYPKASIYYMRCLIGLNLEDEFLQFFTAEYFSDRTQELYVQKKHFKHSVFERKKHPSDMYINELNVKRILIAVGHYKFLKIFERYLVEPYSCLRGWPDLIGLDCGKVRFVEVKQKDKLTIGQLESFRFVNDLFDGGVEVRIAKR